MKAEERRLARIEKHLENLLVFQGGAMADKDTLGHFMIMRDFVHYSLYHNKWGYYPKLNQKYRELMTIGFFDPIPFGNLINRQDYEIYVGKVSDMTPTFATPPALFQPYYGWVLAEYFITVMRSKFDPREPLVIYDIGAGSAHLAMSVLDFLAEHYPEVYAHCEYHLIEMSSVMIPIQRKKLIHHYHHVHIHHISIHNWRTLEPRRCFFIGIELLSNMPHDCVTWTVDGSTHEQWVVFTEKDNLGSGTERYKRLEDPIILRYLKYSDWMKEESFHALKVLCRTDGQSNIDPPTWKSVEPTIYDPFHVIVTKGIQVHNPWRMAWLPVAQMLMFEVMAQYFPRHHAYFADWSNVQCPIMGINGPVVQSKVRVAKDIYLRRVTDHLLTNGGMVDVCFPTDFEMMTTVYKAICGTEKEVTNMPHPVFWKTFGGDKTSIFTTKSGFNPLLEDFEPFTVFATHHPAEL